jgi:hypothetical protein
MEKLSMRALEFLLFRFDTAPPEAEGCLRVILGDVGANVLEVGYRRI